MSDEQNTKPTTFDPSMLRLEELNREALFFEAYANAQAEVEAASRSSTNPAFNSKYADLQSVWEAIREPFTKHGLSIIQLPDYDAEKKLVNVATIVGHKDGHKIIARTNMPVARESAHGIGSAITYARRYALQSVGGVAPDDDDGNAAVAGGSDAVVRPQNSANQRKAPQGAKAIPGMAEGNQEEPWS